MRGECEHATAVLNHHYHSALAGGAFRIAHHPNTVKQGREAALDASADAEIESHNGNDDRPLGHLLGHPLERIRDNSSCLSFAFPPPALILTFTCTHMLICRPSSPLPFSDPSISRHKSSCLILIFFTFLALQSFPLST